MVGRRCSSHGVEAGTELRPRELEVEAGHGHPMPMADRSRDGGAAPLLREDSDHEPATDRGCCANGADVGGRRPSTLGGTRVRAGGRRRGRAAGQRAGRRGELEDGGESVTGPQLGAGGRSRRRSGKEAASRGASGSRAVRLRRRSDGRRARGAEERSRGGRPRRVAGGSATAQLQGPRPVGGEGAGRRRASSCARRQVRCGRRAWRRGGGRARRAGQGRSRGEMRVGGCGVERWSLARLARVPAAYVRVLCVCNPSGPPGLLGFPSGLAQTPLFFFLLLVFFY